jgi:hypothetical protein
MSTACLVQAKPPLFQYVVAFCKTILMLRVFTAFTTETTDEALF